MLLSLLVVMIGGLANSGEPGEVSILITWIKGVHHKETPRTTNRYRNTLMPITTRI